MSKEVLNSNGEVEGTQLSFISKPLNNTNLTYKSANLIESSYELSITQQRIIALACKKMQPIYIEKRLSPNDLKKVLGAMQFSDLEISTSEFRGEYNIAGNNIYGYLEEGANDLFEKDIKYYDGTKYVKKRWVSTSKFDSTNGLISLTFNTDIILDLLVFNGRYVALFFDMSQNIKSKYAFRIYEILKNKAYIGKYKIDVEEFKFMLQITDKYSDFADLNKKIIKPNIKVINDISDITVTVKTIRCGRSVKWLDFTIVSKDSKTFTPNNDFKNKIPSAFNEVATALSKHGITLTSGDAEMLFNVAIEITKDKYPDMNVVEYIMAKIKVLDNYVKTNDVSSTIGFLKKAIEKDFSIDEIDKKKDSIKFNNFTNRGYDFEALEDMALGHIKYDSSKLLK